MNGSNQHQVITVERQGGYASRCSCGEVTFGGFPSRSAARLALRECLRASGRDEYGHYLPATAREVLP